MTPLTEELTALLKGSKRRLVAAEDLTVRRSVEGKKAYRLGFDDGTVCKGRLLLGAEHAAAWGRLRSQVGSRPFLCAMLGQNGRAVLEEWVEGPVLSMSDPSPEILHRAGEVLAQMHSTAVPGCGVFSAAPQVEESRGWLKALVGAGAFDAATEGKLAAELRALAPDRTTFGLVHHDFCGENLVLHSGRGIVSIDHEWMHVGSHDFSLARALRRWNLDGAPRQAFLKGYLSSGGSADLGALDFWLLANDIFASEVRVRRGWPDAPATVDRLVAWTRR